MIRLFSFIVLAAWSIAGFAQYYYNPYNNPQSTSAGYEIGQRIAERIIQQQEEALRNNPLLMSGAMIQAIASGNDSKAYEYADYLAGSRGAAEDWYWLGVLNEAGICYNNVDFARRCYIRGQQEPNSAACTARLNELDNGNRVTAQQVRNYCRQISAMAAASTPIPDFGSGSSSVGSTRSSSSCPRCHGTGVESTPAAINSPSVGAGAAAQGLVGYTHTNGGSCPYCGRYEYHIHYKCYDSNYHRR